MKSISLLATLICFLAFFQATAQSSLKKDLDSFDEIKLGGSFDVYLEKGSKEAIKIELSRGDISDLNIDVFGSTLEVRPKRGRYGNNNVRGKIWITFNTLNEISGSGSSDIVCKSTIKSNRLRIANSGSGSMELAVDVSSLKASFSGSGDLELTGQAGDLSVTLSGSSRVEAMDCSSKAVDIRISGSGDVSVNVSESLEATVSGSGNIRYKGSPDKVNSRTSGSGRIQKVG